MSEGFLNNCRDFHTDCVSHRAPVKSRARCLARRAPRHSQPDPLDSLVLRIGVPPTLARASVPLSLTRLVATHTLPISGS
jgi:hypothetical protein